MYKVKAPAGGEAALLTTTVDPEVRNMYYNLCAPRDGLFADQENPTVFCVRRLAKHHIHSEVL